MSSSDKPPNQNQSSETPQGRVGWLRSRVDDLITLIGQPHGTPLILGVLLTLIGVFVLLIGEKVNGVIVCYVGVMTLVVAAGILWTQLVLEQQDVAVGAPPASKGAVLDGGDLRAQSRNAILVACCFVGIVITALAIVCVATVTVFKGGTATALLWGLGSFFSGAFLGFLFSIPFETELEKTAKTIEHLNTSLNQIADWLTKIIVGVSLVNAQEAYKYFVNAARTLGAGLVSNGPNPTPPSEAFAAGLIVTFFLMGFIGTYLLGRLWISAAVVRADLITVWLSGKFPKDRAIITTVLPGGTRNEPYQTTTIQTTGLTTPLNWSVPDLPAGLNLDQNTGTISGRPQGTFSKTLKFIVTDSATPPNILTKDLELEIKDTSA